MQGNTELTAAVQLAAQKSNPLVTLLPVILIGVVFYFLLFRPQRRRQQQQAQMQRRLQPGQRVMTTAGLIGVVVAIEDDAIVLEIAPGVEVRFVKQAIGQVLPEDVEEDDEDDEEDEDADEESAEALQDDVEAKTEPHPGTLPGSAGNKTEDASRGDGEDKSGRKPSA